ncbi:MAG: hypothetical protein IJB59_01505 [Oscillospiraceae bacterium]|nr:hypothetical protein [Oscillospiraceae bacterium]
MDDIRQNLDRIDAELRAMEEPLTLEDSDRMFFGDEEPLENRAALVEVKKKKFHLFRFLLFLSILVLIGWWYSCQR